MDDISATLAPKSDQLDAIELIGHPQTFTVTAVDVKKNEAKKGDADQPVSVHLAEFPRVWRPSLGMRRVLAACWGRDSSKWVGNRVTLYCDESVRFGNDVVGGTRISHLTGIDGPKTIPVPESRAKVKPYRVLPLPELTTKERVASLRAEWKHADPERKKAIEAEVAALTQPPQADVQQAEDGLAYEELPGGAA